MHEKHQTEEYLNEQAFQKRKEANAEYLKEYGTAAQKMLEITQRYAEQISEATTGAEKKLLSKQRDTELASITSSEFTQQMDWVSILGGAGDQFNEIVEKALKDSREYLNTDEFKNASAETKKTLVDAIQRMEGVLSDDSGLDFQSVGNAMQEYQNSVLELNTAKIEEAEAIKKLTEAQEAYAKALKEGTDADKKSAGVALENAQANTDAASQNVQTLTEQSQGAMQNVQEASQKLKAGMDGVVSGLSSILSGDSLRGIWDGLINIGDSLDGALGKMAESMKSVPIVGWILSILDLIKDGLVPLLSNIGDLIAGIIDTATEETFSGQIFVAIFDLVKKILISAADAITLGAFDLSGRRKAIIEETNKQNAELAQQEYLAQYEINQLYRERYEWEKKIGETAMENAKRNTAEAEKQLKATGDEEAKILKKLQGQEYIEGYSTKKTGLFGWGKGKTVENRASLSGMGYDEILELEAQGKLTEEAQEYLNALRASKEEGEDLADTLIEAQEALREAVVGMGFDDVVNHAMDDLLDGTKTAAEAFDEIMQGAMTKMLQEMMNDDIRDWYEGFAAAGEDGYTQAEKEYWKARWEDVQRKNEQAKEDIEEITGEDFDMGTQGQADANAITAIQEEAPGSIDGKLTALQISSSQTATNTSILVVGQSNTQASILEMRDGMDTLNGNVRLIYKEAKLIKEYTSELPEMAKNIKQVVTNTSKL